MGSQTSVELPGQSESLLIEKLSPESAELERKIEQALAICDRHLGEGLYSFERIKNIINAKHNYFLIVFCCYTARFSGAARELECKGRYLDDNGIAGVCRSIAVENEYRSSGISEYLLNMSCDLLFGEENAKLIAVPAWVRKDTGSVPAGRLLETCGFEPAETILHPWRKYGAVKCTACNKNPCECDCKLYIKRR